MLNGILLLAAAFAVEPMTIYRAEKPCDVQFYDAQGRAVYPGSFRNARLVAAPAEAARANVKLEKVAVTDAGVPIDDPAFWIERSLVELNTGDHLRVKPRGYALSPFLPATVEFKCTPDPKDPRKKFHTECMHRIWYDRDLNELSITMSRHLGTTHCPTNATYVRFLIPWSQYDNFTAARLVPATFGKDHPLRTGFPRETAAEHPGEIVLAADCDLRERYAAVSLRRKIRTVTGRRIPIVTVPDASAAFRIFLGAKAAGGRMPKELAGTDGYAVRADGRDVYAFGASPRGTIYATARLMELAADYTAWRPNRACGVRFRPCETIDFASVAAATSVPRFKIRTWSYGGGMNADFDEYVMQNYAARIYSLSKAVTGFDYHMKERGGYCRMGKDFLSLATSGKDVPDEFYPEVGGKRLVGTGEGQPCYSNPEVVKATVAEATRMMLEEAPEEMDFFDFAYSDSWRVCDCANCLKPIRLPDGTEQACTDKDPRKDPFFRSTRTYMVANEVAKAVRAIRPGMKTDVSAYVYDAPLPRVKLDPGIITHFAAYDTAAMNFPILDHRRGVLYCPESWGARWEKWLKEEPQACGLYGYYFTASLGLYAEPAAADLRALAASGATWRVHSQTQWDDAGKSQETFGRNEQMWDTNAMEHWIISRLMWDPSQDVAALRREFLRRVYGKGAEALAKWYAEFAKKWFDMEYSRGINCHVPAQDAYLRYVKRTNLEASLFSAIKEAEKRAPSDAVRRHLGKMRTTLEEIAAATGRDTLPFSSGLDGVWRDASSPLWNGAFRVPSMRKTLVTGGPTNAFDEVKTEVDLAMDAKWLYFRVHAEGADPANGVDRVELRFLRGDGKRLSFEIGADGRCEDALNLNPTWESGWETAQGVGRIPLAAIRKGGKDEIHYVVIRHYADGSQSFGRALANQEGGQPGARDNSFSHLVADPTEVGDYAEPPAKKPVALKPVGPAAGDFRAGRWTAAKFPVKAGEAYHLSFTGRLERTYLPRDEQYLQEAVRRLSVGPAFATWRVLFRDAAGKKTGEETPTFGKILDDVVRGYDDVFRAPTNAVSAEVEIVPPQWENRVLADGFALAPHDCGGSLVLDGHLASGRTRVSCGGWSEGAGIRELNGRRVFDSGWAAMCFGFEVEPGRDYVIRGERTRYWNRHTSVNLWFFDEKGKKVLDSGLPWEKNRSDGVFEFTVTCPPGAIRATFMLYNAYYYWIEVKPRPGPALARTAKGQTPVVGL